MWKFTRRIAVVVALAEVSYLVLANLALNVPLTQDLVNQIRPDKFNVEWESGWTWYPGQVSVKAVDASGRTPRQQWRVSVARASGQVSLLPLIARNVRVNGVEAKDLTFSLQPGSGAGFDNATRAVPGDDGAPASPTRSPAADGGGAKNTWNVALDGIRVTGSHSVRVSRFQAALAGELRGNFSVRAPRGPLSLSNGELDLSVESVVRDDGRRVLEEGRISGEVRILPVDPRVHRGLEILNFLSIDGNLSATTDSLAFLNPYLKFFQGIRVEGAGVVNGHVVLDRGVLRPGTELDVSAQQLDLHVIDLAVQGEGGMTIAVPETGDETRIVIELGELNAYSNEDRVALLQGVGMEVRATGPASVVPDREGILPSSRVSLEIPSLRVPDISAYQRFLPGSWAFALHGGEGELQGSVELSDNAFDASLDLKSQQADIGFGEFRFRSDLDMRIIVDSASLEQGLVDVSGTYFHLNNGRLTTEDEESDPWSAAIDIEKGVVRLNLEEADDGITGARHLVTKLKQTGFGSLVEAADEELELTGTVSDLRWLNLLFENELGLAIRGSGAVNADVIVSSGQVGEGTRLVVEPDALSVDVLDYRATGDGEVVLDVVKGGDRPDVSLSVVIDGARFGRLDSEESFVEDVDLSLEALVRALEIPDDEPDVELHLKIPSARITDMSIYNQYFPDSSPIEIIGGEADLEVDVWLRPDDAAGFVRLVTSGLRSRLDGQEITGDLHADITLAGGAPKDREFDVSGSSLVLDGVRVIGDEESFRDEDWSANIDLTRAQAVWKVPIHLDVDANISMTDSMPLVSILANERGKHGWLEKAMTIDNVQGTASVRIDDRYIVIPSAFVSSDKIDVGAKGVIREDDRTGMLYLRYGILKALLETKDGKRNLDVINTRKQFDAYSTDEVLRSLSETPD